MKKVQVGIFMFLCVLAQYGFANTDEGVRIKDLCRLLDARDNPLVGYGLVTGLAGTGDSSRSKVTTQSISNVLKNFGIIVSPREISSRSVAAVMVTASLEPFAQNGDKLDVYVNAVGDARSLLGGTLLVTELKAADSNVYALAQGPISIGGFHYDKNGNLIQKNHPNSGKISSGGVVERSVHTALTDHGKLDLALKEPDFTTVSRITDKINSTFNSKLAHGVHAGKITVDIPENYRGNVVGFITALENVEVNPGYSSRIVINEKTGTVVAGGDIFVSKVSITHGDLNIDIRTGYNVSQPYLVRQLGDGVRTVVTPDSSIKVGEDPPKVLNVERTTVANLVESLHRIKATSRDIITILQAVKRAGGFHADIIVE